MYCIGDANGKMMLAHAASAQGISGSYYMLTGSLSFLQHRFQISICHTWIKSLCFLVTVVEQVTGRDHVLNHLSIPAACFTHPEISMVGLTEVKLLFL